MKKLLSLLILAGMMVFAGCGDDDDDDPPAAPAGTSTTFDGTSYTLTNGYFEDYGSDGTHYNIDFIVANGTANFETEAFNGTFIIYSELFSPGTDSFRTGTFNYEAFGEAEDDDFYFNTAFIIVDGDGDGRIGSDSEDITDEDLFLVDGGTVTVSGTSPNYTIVYDLDFVSGETYNATFSGTFTNLD